MNTLRSGALDKLLNAMLILLPPSETKRDGGIGEPLDLGALSFERLTAPRRTVLALLAEVSKSRRGAMAALKLGPRGESEIDRNRAIASSPTMQAIERYTGVLFDALDVAGLDAPARMHATERVAIHSALFGIVRADDLIPAYRLSHNSRLPGLSLAAHWRQAITRELTEQPGMVLDLRSEGYVKLGPAPVGNHAVTIRVVARSGNGHVRTISHANKHAKGLFVRDLLHLDHAPETLDDLVATAGGMGWTLVPEAAADGRRVCNLVI